MFQLETLRDISWTIKHLPKCFFVIDKNTVVPLKSEIIIKFTRSTIDVILYANISKLSNIKK